MGTVVTWAGEASVYICRTTVFLRAARACNSSQALGSAPGAPGSVPAGHRHLLRPMQQRSLALGPLRSEEQPARRPPRARAEENTGHRTRPNRLRSSEPRRLVPVQQDTPWPADGRARGGGGSPPGGAASLLPRPPFTRPLSARVLTLSTTNRSGQSCRRRSHPTRGNRGSREASLAPLGIRADG